MTPNPEISRAVLDAVFLAGLEADRAKIEQAAVTREVFTNAGWARYRKAHPAVSGLDDGERYNAIGEGLAMIGAETVTWLLGKGHLQEPEPGRLMLGKPLDKYVPGSQQEEDLFHGLRRVTEKRTALIRESMATLGDLRNYFPVLLDEDGNIVDGRHRREIDPDWPAMRVPVPKSERLAVSLAANRSNSWTADDWERLRRAREAVVGRQRASADLARIALMENADRSDRAIARLTGTSDKTIAQVRRDLGESAEIPQFGPSHGGRPSNPLESRVEELLRENPEQSNRQVLAVAGLSDNQHRIAERVRERLEQSGDIPAVTSRRGSDGTTRQLPPQPVFTPPVPPPVPAPVPKPVSQPRLEPQPEPLHEHAPHHWALVTYCECGHTVSVEEGSVS